MQSETIRTWLVRWMLAAAIVHLAVGLLLPWVVNANLFDSYHRGIETAFWGGAAPVAARSQQVWWISLFGPTIQSVALWMFALVHLGDRYRSSFAWAMLFIGIAIWAPQDMWISLKADCWTNVWVDVLSAVTMLPPLFCLWRIDRPRKLAGSVN